MPVDESLLSSPAKKHWERVGVRHHHGIALPLFSLRSAESAGIGEYSDLIPLINWCHEVGFDLIQLLPLNDTGLETSPYAAISAFALNPIHLGLAQLPYVKENSTLINLLYRLQACSNTERVDYVHIQPLRECFLKKYIQEYGSEIEAEAEFKQFLKDNSWLEPFALFKSLKQTHHQTAWEDWEINLQRISKESWQPLCEKFHEEIRYHSLIQYLCFQQLKKVKAYAEERQIFLKGDIPILINRDSADVWQERALFNLDFEAGAPPDMFTEDGQNWGFPIYDWQEMEKRGFSWWIDRIHVASQCYHLYRLDHLVGFFRIWAIRRGKTAKEGLFIPSDFQAALKQGTKILHLLLATSTMMPIGEDLGCVPDEVRHILDQLGICGTRVVRWERFWEGDKSYIPYDHYNPKSMTTLSTHDTETLRDWWEAYPQDVKEFIRLAGGEFKLTPEWQKKILRDSHHTSSLFHVNLLQEYLDLIPGFTMSEASKERINKPGTVSDQNWTYKFRQPLEAIVANEELKKLIRDLLR